MEPGKITKAEWDMDLDTVRADVTISVPCPFCWPHDFGQLDPQTRTFSCTHCGTALLPFESVREDMRAQRTSFHEMQSRVYDAMDDAEFAPKARRQSR